MILDVTTAYPLIFVIAASDASDEDKAGAPFAAEHGGDCRRVAIQHERCVEAWAAGPGPRRASVAREIDRVVTDYRLLEKQVRELLSEENDPIANAANFTAFVYGEIPDISWAGFYYADPKDELVLGPFQGRPACTRLPKGRGVCGAALSSRQTVVVDDVSQFADHIACDPAARSEIVIPLVVDNFTYGVFDLDSARPSRFSSDDQRGIERLVQTFVSLIAPPKRGEKESPPFGE